MYIRNDINPRYFAQEWSKYLDDVRSGKRDAIDLTEFQSVGEDDAEYDYGWLQVRTLLGGLPAVNSVEIIVGTHAERRRVLRVVSESLHLRGLRGRVYNPNALNTSNPLIEGFDPDDSVRVDSLELFLGQSVALTHSLALSHKIYPTGSRGKVTQLEENFVRVLFEEGDEEPVPINSVLMEDRSRDPAASWKVVMLGVRPAVVSTAHSYQSRTVPLGTLYVISLATVWALHGLAYSFLSRARSRDQIAFYRTADVTTFENVVDVRVYGLYDDQPHRTGVERGTAVATSEDGEEFDAMNM